MKLLKILKMSFFFIFIYFFSANAQNALKSSDIDQYLTSLNSITVMMESYNNENRAQEEAEIAAFPAINELSQTPITDSLIYVKSHPTYSKFEMIIKSSGFQTVEQWANIGDQIMTAYSAYYIKNPESSDAKSIDFMINDLSSQRNQIEKNQFISVEQKNILIEKIENSIALLKDPNYIDNENIKSLSPYINRLNSMFKEPQ